MIAIDASAALASVRTLAGVGPVLERALVERLGIARVQDLWFHLPLRYEDRTRITPIAELVEGGSAQIEAKVVAVERGFARRLQLRVAIEDQAGDSLTLRFFHFRREQIAQLSPGTRLRCYGEVRHGLHGLEMVHPEYQWIAAFGAALEDRLTPIYPTTEGLAQKRFAKLISAALVCLPSDVALELIPAALLDSLQLMSLREALLYVHRPPPQADTDALMLGLHPAQRRLAFEELLSHHLVLKRLRAKARRHAAPRLAGDGQLRRHLLRELPFDLTAAQRRVNREVCADLAEPVPMLRLLQGDVGSGKTVVAAVAALAAIEAGYQVALMAPTELLAEQHLRILSQWLAPLQIDPVWLAGKVQGVARRNALARVAEGAPLVVGTHALMQDGVTFARLGLAIIDEQHRFGVHQRLALRDKGRTGNEVPHQLVLTATPIPRTLAMSSYADLDISVIDELPPGRTPVQTVVISAARRGEVIERIRVACAEGRQVYWVCTLIEESEQLEAQAAEVAYRELTATLPGLRIGLIHGRMKAAEKQAAMAAFRSAETTLLVATTVIEVGVDVPNASLMVIENAERLGLAQLHQLRGRVGRGSLASTCVLLYQPRLSQHARERLQTMRETTDGFVIAEKDLQLRGPGEVLGTRQTGRLELRIADVLRDAELMPEVERIGVALLDGHPDLIDPLVARWVGGAARYAGA